MAVGCRYLCAVCGLNATIMDSLARTLFGLDLDFKDFREGICFLRFATLTPDFVY